ncbi:MAG: ABC transporter permease subunit [Spirochaetales bacterium]|nr:ABC transporter permease subunit [Spirochaetales bacterium]
MNWSRIRAIMRKDLRSVTAEKMVLVPMIVVPLVLCVIVPGAITIAAVSLDEVLMTGVQYVEKLIPLYPVPEELAALTDQVLFIILNYTFLPYFMLVPIMASSVIAANSIVGEKERKTLETLLYTPVTNREFLTAKLLASFVPAVLVSWIAFGGYFLTLNLIYGLVRGTLIVRSWIWLPAILLLSPGVSALGLSVTLLVSLKAKTYNEAQQTAGIIVLPFILLIVVQVAGLVTFRPALVVALAAILMALAYLIIIRLAPRFSREAIISTL